MRLLVISSYLPYPLLSGGQVRLYNLIKALSSQHEITLICEIRSNQNNNDVKEIEKICHKVITIPRKKQWSVKNIINSGFSQNSFLVTGHTQDAFRAIITEELQKNVYDLIHCETYYVMQNIPQVTIPIVLAEHNIEYSVYKKFINKLPFLFRPLLAVDIAKIKREEKVCWERAAALISVSTEDNAVMKKAGFDSFIISNGVNINQFSYKDVKKESDKKEKRILFIGDFSWIQNTDSVEYIIKNIWPEFKKLLSKKENAENVKLWIVGREIPAQIRALSNDESILYDEESSKKSTHEIFQSASILLAPIRVGGGTSYKILESMACGTPVVTMGMSAAAINAKDRENIMVGTNATELARKVFDLLEDKKQYESIAKKARVLIEENYSWDMIAKELEKVYKKVVQ